MYALWRFLVRLKRLPGFVTGLPIVGGWLVLVAYAARLAWEQQFTDVLKGEIPNWYQFTLASVAAGTIGWGLGFLGGRPSSRWLERKAAGVWFEVLAMSSMTHFQFRNMGARGPLGGEMLAYDLAFKIRALYNLRNVRLEIVVSDNTGSKVGCFTDRGFKGDVSPGLFNALYRSSLRTGI
jgi:hypothetical protein